MALVSYGSERAAVSADALARGLGWFSIGLGVAELLAPRQLTRMLGMQGGEALVQGFGAREIATGVAILSSQQPAPWVWARVGGDVVDLATLASGLDEGNPKRGNVGLALAAVAAVTAVDVLCASALGAAADSAKPVPMHDYHGRSGFPRPPAAMRGAASDFVVPRDFRIPAPMRPHTSAKPDPQASGVTPPGRAAGRPSSAPRQARTQPGPRP